MNTCLFCRGKFGQTAALAQKTEEAEADTVKIIHCADVHLDSRMMTNLDERKAKIRREEILNTFLTMIDYGEEHGVEAVLIAGDLFDTVRVSATTRGAVEAAIRNHPQMDFYLLRGNHDVSGFLNKLSEMPDNLKLFDTEWTQYVLNPERAGNIVLTGAELTAANAGTLYNRLVLDYDAFNLVMLHGQQSSYTGRNKAENITLPALKGKGIDYLALGHVHEFHMEDLDKRGRWCYSGCLEGRGFDECGEHGFVLLDVDENTLQYTCEKIPFAQRTIYVLETDVTGCRESTEIYSRVEETLRQAQCRERDLVKIILTGQVDVTCEKNTDFVEQRLSPLYFGVKVEDETKFAMDFHDYELDESLKGEFVRLVMDAQELDEETKYTVIRYGLQALAGEDIE